MRHYRKNYPTQAEVNAAAREIAAQLKGLPLSVQPNGYGHRIACTVTGCGWSRCHDTVQGARTHAGTHA